MAGVTLVRYLLLGANTPWKRMRLTLGLGTRATSQEMAAPALAAPVWHTVHPVHEIQRFEYHMSGAVGII